MIKIIKKVSVVFSFLFLSFLLTSCGENNSTPAITDLVIEEGLKTALKEEGISFDKMSDLVYNEVEITDDDFEALKSKYADRVAYIKYETKFSLISVDMDMTGNYSAIYVYNNGIWQFSFGYYTDKDAWTYVEKEASRVDKQRMLSDLKTLEFASFEKGYVGDPKYSSIGSITNREYDASVHRDTIETTITVETDFAKYSIPVKMIYFFNKGEWKFGDVEIGNLEDWILTYNNGSAPEFLSDSIILSYLTVDTNFLTYVGNLEYIDDYSIKKVSEIATKTSVEVIYEFSVDYENIGNVKYNVLAKYEWLNNEWSEAKISVSFADADFSDFIALKWNSDSEGCFTFSEITKNEDNSFNLKGKYSKNSDVDIVCKLSVPLRDNNWDAAITDINGNQIWDIPASSFSIDLQYGAIVYNNIYYAPVDIDIPVEEEVVEETINTSNVLEYGKEIYDNEITKNGLMMKNISVKYENSIVEINGEIHNLTEGQSGYNIGIVLFDSDSNIIGEGSFSSMADLTAGSSSVVKIEIPDIDDDSIISNITIYLRN